MIQADTALNLTWLLLCVAAAAYHVHAERSRGSASSLRGWVTRALSLFLAMVSLFPSVSASDDSVRFEYMDVVGHMQTPNAPRHQPDHSKKSREELATLVRLLEALESVQVAVGWSLAVFLCFLCLVIAEWRKGIDRRLPGRSGRDPPALSFSFV